MTVEYEAVTSSDDGTGWWMELYERGAILTPNGARLERTALHRKKTPTGDRSPERSARACTERRLGREEKGEERKSKRENQVTC